MAREKWRRYKGWTAPVTEEEQAAYRLGGADAAWAVAKGRIRALKFPP